MVQIPLPTPRVSQMIQLKRMTPKVSYLRLHAASASICFFGDEPLAVYVGGAVYFHSETAAHTKTINDFHPNAPHVRSDPSQFDFVLGQTLTMAGLPLTRLEKSDA